jgi:hypothetical protein
VTAAPLVALKKVGLEFPLASSGLATFSSRLLSVRCQLFIILLFPIDKLPNQPIATPLPFASRSLPAASLPSPIDKLTN